MASILWMRLPTRTVARTCRSSAGLTARYVSNDRNPGPSNKPLTQSNPKSLDLELSNSPATPSSSLPTLTLDFSPPDASLGTTGRTGAKSSKDSLSTIEKRRKAMGRVALAMFGISVVFGVFYMGREWDEYERPGRTQDLLDAGRWRRTQTRLGEATDVFSKPQWKELLPPPLPPPHQKPYTLVLSLDDLLITSVWDRKDGYKTAKRPGVDYFLAYLSQFYEVVIFTTQPHYTALPVVDLLDRYRFFLTYHLFRESTRVVDGKIVKDLSFLNRDLSKVIMLDTHPDHVYTHPENSILLPPWKGDVAGGKGLVGLIPFLESIAFFNPKDVRPILTAYRGKDIALEYAKFEAAEKQKFLEEWRQKGGSKRGASNISFSGLFGHAQNPFGGSMSEPLTYLEQRRRYAQMMYLQEQQYIKENEELLEKSRQEEIDKQREMAGSLVGWLESMTGKKPAEKALDPANPLSRAGSLQTSS